MFALHYTTNIMNKLTLPLKTKWFGMTDQNGKTEDYRKVNAYWCKRLCGTINEELIESIRQLNEVSKHISSINLFGVKFKKFETNVMTLGYPKSTDKSRIKEFEHAGIEIGFGKQEWGAEPNKIYFVIKHGKQINHE